MQYLLLIYEEENRFANLGKSEMDKELAEYRAFGKEFASAIQGGNALQPTGTATTGQRTRFNRSHGSSPWAKCLQRVGWRGSVSAGIGFGIGPILDR